MSIEQKVKIALVRGDSLNDWEGKMWENLDSRYAVTGFCSNKNLYQTHLTFPVQTLGTSSDNFIENNFRKYWSGIFQQMHGLESKLNGYHIAHTAEIYYAYTNQAVQAKKLNKELKVVCTVWDNTVDRFATGYWPLIKKAPKFWLNKVESIVNENINKVDILLPVTQGAKEVLLNRGVDESKIRVLTPALVPYRTDEQAIRNIMHAYGLTGRKFIVAVNRLVIEKGVYDVVAAFAGLLKEQISELFLVVIGDGPERNRLQNKVKNLGLENRVIFIPKMPNSDVRVICSQAECLVLASHTTPTWQEQFGYVLAEAMSVGTPVLGAQSGAIPEVVGTGGVLFHPGDILDQKAKLLYLLQNRAALSASAKEESKKFDAKRFQKELTDVYQSLHS